MTVSRTRHTTSIVLACVLVIATAVLGGCKKKVEVTAAWPVAIMERVIPQPTEPARWPYTGQDAEDSKTLSRRPLSVKIENSDQARPQAGLNSADVVYETVTEGGITRFNCIFHSTVPAQVGPVRSARFSDLWVVRQYDGLFFFSGASTIVNRAVNAAKLPNLSEDNGISAPYERSSERAAPHNLFLDTKEAYAEAARRGHKTTATLKPLQFGRRAGTETTETIAEVSIPFSDANKVRWAYDEKSGRYRRWNNGRVHEDAATGDQVNADNVVIMWAKYTPKSRDKVGSTTYDITLGGKGRVTILKGGRRFDGTWEAAKDAPPRFRDANGRPIKLTPGRTWFQVISLDTNITLK